MAAGKGKGKGKNRGGGRLRSRAVNDVQLMMQPQFDYNNAQLQQTQENYGRAQQAAQSASGGAFDAIGAAQNPGFDRIADQFTANLNALAPEFGGAGAAMPYTQNSIYGERGGTIGMPEAEVAAGNALGGAIGQAGISGLANDDARWGMLREGAQREASTFGRNSQAALQDEMLNALRQHENEQQNLMAQQPFQIKSRLDELKDQAIEQQLARSKMRSDRAFSEAIQAQLQGMLGGSTRPRRPGDGSNGSGLPPGVGPGGSQDIPGQGTVSHANIDNYGGGGSPGPGQQIMSQVRTAQELSDLPGWVRYAYNRQGASPRVGPDILQDAWRRRLYNRKIAPFLQRTQGPTWPEGT